MDTETLIIGGGLAGLCLADHLHRAGKDFILIEARERLGGRILTERIGDAYFDMGPAWFWPGQPRIAALIERLKLDSFEQYSNGDLIAEDGQGRVQRGTGFSSMEGSWRLKGGLAQLIAALADTLPADRIHLDAPVTALTYSNHKITAKLSETNAFSATQAVIAAPPRVVQQTISFAPALPDAAQKTMNEIPTWMAGQAKAIAVYDTAFWRESGLSGDAMSRTGPMVEIHDASPAIDGPYALFGFIGIPPEARQDEASLRTQILAQLVRLFGLKAAAPKALFIKDWAKDQYTAADQDQRPLYSHPQYGLRSDLAGLWNNTLHFSGTEVATQFGGYLEGALEAAEHTFGAIVRDGSGA